MAQKSILLVTVDCLRANHVGFMGYPRPTTPFLDSLADESFVFPTTIVAGAPTYYSLPAVLASRYPLALGRDVLGLAPAEPTLATVFKQAGYATAAFTAANPYISARFGYDRGFDIFRDFLDDDSPGDKKNATELAPVADGARIEPASKGLTSRLNRKLQEWRHALGPLGAVYDELYFQYCQRSIPAAHSLDALRRFPAADVIVDAAWQWLESIGDTPFFLWLHLMDPHAPYYPKNEALALMGDRPVPPFRARYLNSYWNRGDLGPRRLARHRDDVIDLYDAGIRWVDSQLSRLAGKLRETNQWDQCIFALTADHGEEFLDHDGRFHPPSQLTEELIHVPLLLHVPGSAKKELGKTPFGLLHLAPTLLDASGLSTPPSFRGQSYWAQIRDGTPYDAVAVSECVSGCTNPFRRENRLGPRILSVRGPRYKLVMHFDRQREYLYDLEADPGEQAPLSAGSQKSVRRRLLEIAREHVKASLNERDARARLQARLRELRLTLPLEWKNQNPADESLSQKSVRVG
jgi:arylsulfatase A-like enzyme